MKQFLLCADDFGLSEEINLGILTLLEQQKLNAVSCMTNMPLWQKDGKKLTRFHQHAKIGLHFSLPYRSLGILILQAYLGLLNAKKIQQMLEAQFNAFIDVIGSKPDFLDGHQHIHQLPKIREIFIHFYQTHYPDKQAFVRSSVNQQKNFKARLINLLGAKTLKKLLIKLNIPHNSSFSGIYNLTPGQDYQRLLDRFISETKDGGLIMCHPAQQLPHSSSREAFRFNEFKALESYDKRINDN